METSLEYISAGIILALILGITGQYSTNMVNDRIINIEGTSGLQLADKIVDTLLLTPGSPSNWGNSIDPPKSMGFALENAIKSYQLDKSKIKCLYNDSNNYIPPYQIRDLLGLSKNYYISIEIYPMYSIFIESITSEKFKIAVTNQWGIPVSTAVVKGAYTDYASINSTEVNVFLNGNLQNAVFRENMTDVNGNCILNFSGSGEKASLLVLCEQLNVKSVKIWSNTSSDIIDKVCSSVGIDTGFNVEIVYRSIEIDGLNYFCKFKMWWS
ncbi:MAG: hypothetical protein NTY03_02145 [Candidatus Bathyarchaeota archaeon]|nr:hypothetical protein [Candidatus Bathyarchaeota archaeon]